MLASITPLGERGRHSHYPITLTAFVLGATVAGALGGLALGALGALLLGGVGVSVRLALLAAALLAALALDAGPATVPGPRRQVNERWLDRYRGWVYGLGFGAQMGVGVATIVTSAATYAALAAALLSAQSAAGALILGLYGALRGLTPLLAVRSHTPAQLMALHAGLARVQPPVSRGATAVLAATGIAAVVGVLA